MNKFLGAEDEFKVLIESVEKKGKWEDFAMGLRYKTVDGGIIQWYKSTGTIQIQGETNARARIQKNMENVEPDDVKTASPAPSTHSIEKKVKKIDSKIFVVHGHDSTSREQLELILHKLGLEHFVLANSGGDGLTIIEALEKEIGKDGGSKFGIVLLTPDDFGYSKIDGPDKVQPRARQNVVLEMGMLISAIGRKNTVILKKGHLEIPSDASGILYLGFNDHVKEIVPKLVDRLESSGFSIDSSRITNAAS